MSRKNYYARELKADCAPAVKVTNGNNGKMAGIYDYGSIEKVLIAQVFGDTICAMYKLLLRKIKKYDSVTTRFYINNMLVMCEMDLSNTYLYIDNRLEKIEDTVDIVAVFELFKQYDDKDILVA